MTVRTLVLQGWDLSRLAEAAKQARDEGVALLTVHVELGKAIIGPMMVPGEPGCHECLARRRQAADPAYAADAAKLLELHIGRLAEPSPWLTPFAVDTIEALVEKEKARTRGAVIVVDLATMTTQVHPFLPDPWCPACSELPEEERPARVVLKSRPKETASGLRAKKLSADSIRATYVDSFAGVVGAVSETQACGLPVSYAPTGKDIGIGRATDRVTSGLAAVLEAVERRAGLGVSSRRNVIRARFGEVAETALDPKSLGGFASPDDAEMNWVSGYSFGREAPILVPESYAYYGHSDERWCYETSNGCALGTCYEEAALHGLLEVAERDAFLMMWYARRPVPRIDLESLRSTDVRLLSERIERLHGYQINVFDTTMEQGIPAVAALAIDKQAGEDELRPVVMCSAGAHLDAEQACWAAIGELTLLVEHHTRVYADDPQKRAKAAAMVADANLVREMDDHALLYSHLDTLPRWDFLLGSDIVGKPLSIEPAQDLRDDLLELVRRYLTSDLDVIVVDQTGPEQRVEGLSAVKAIVPGTLPMTFGHRNRRVEGLPRLLRYARNGINPHPHPFP